MWNFRIKRFRKLTCVFCLGLIVAFILTGCATQTTDREKAGLADAEPSPFVEITSIGLSQDADSVKVEITGTQPLTYTSVKQPQPLGVVLYFPNTRLNVPEETVQSLDAPVRSVNASQIESKNDTSRVEILMAKDAPYNVVQEGNTLTVLFTKSLSKPKDADNETTTPSETTTAEAAPVETTTAAVAPVETTSLSKPSGTFQGTGYQIEDKEPVWVNRIDFLGEANGRSTLSIETTTQVEYSLKKTTGTLLELRLMNANIAEFRQRPLITTRFESAVNRIMPVQLPSMHNYSLFSIELREPVGYYLEQVDGLLLVHFEASTIPPVPVDEANLPAWKKALVETIGPVEIPSYAVATERGTIDNEQTEKQTTSATGVPLHAVSPETEFDTNQALVIQKPGKKFSGEKIALDFYKTDIKNVFRILREVSGKNFAIDNDVSGKVTLTLENPVPWDQILDLVLRMNQLGLVAEGDIFRIATLSTLKKENDLRKAQIAAFQKEREQLKALEPLETHYLPISYSDATTEILPHIEKIITKGRGSATVDGKNNQIIITDTAEKVRQARAITKQIDKVTAQVIIEARVVEVEESFTKELGFSWNMSVGPVTMNNNGSAYMAGVAMNFPTTSTNGFALNYAKIAGTPITLDATLTAIEANGKGKILSAPKIVTLNNKTARIKQGNEVGYLERDSAGGSSVKFKDVDLMLEVTPHVTPDNRISMSIHITKNDVTDFVNGVPIISTNEATTELLVNDGDTVVIGGIIKSSVTEAKSAFPGLHKIPVLGWMFQSNLKNTENLELLIFMNPKIVQLEQRYASYLEK